MPSKLRPRLTYANVAATIAVVLAFTTSGAAQPVADGAASVGKRVKKALKLGKQANKRARQAKITAKKADKDAKLALDTINAGVPLAKRALTADDATAADSASNASALGGLGASAFERSTRIQYGQGSLTATTQQPLFAWSQMGIAVRTDGDSDTNPQVTIANTHSAGGPELKIGNLTDEAGGTGGGVAASSSQKFGPVTGSVVQLIVSENAGSGGNRSMLITCKANNHGANDGMLMCLGIRSAAQ